MQDLCFLKNNNFYTLSRTSLSRKVANRVQNRFRIFGYYALVGGRMIRSLYGPQFTRYRFMDARSPGTYHPQLWYYAYRLFYWSVLAAGVCMLGILLRALVRRLRRGRFFPPKLEMPPRPR